MGRRDQEAVVIVVEFDGQIEGTREDAREIRERGRTRPYEGSIPKDVHMARPGNPRTSIVGRVEGESRDDESDPHSGGAHGERPSRIEDFDSRLADRDRDIVPDLRGEGGAVRAHELSPELDVGRSEGWKGCGRIGRLLDERVVHIESDSAMVRGDARQAVRIEDEVRYAQLNPSALDAEGRSAQRVDNLNSPRGWCRGRTVRCEQRSREQHSE